MEDYENEMEGSEEEGSKEKDEWQAKCDMDCLLQAESIKSDPKRLAAALKVAEKKKSEIESLEELRSTIKQKQSEIADASMKDRKAKT